MYGRLASVLTVNIFIPSSRFNMQRPSKSLCLLHRLGPCLEGTLKFGMKMFAAVRHSTYFLGIKLHILLKMFAKHWDF